MSESGRYVVYALPHVPHSLAPGSQTVCHLPWLKVSVALRYVRTFPWAPEAWREVRQHIPWLLAEQARAIPGTGNPRPPLPLTAAGTEQPALPGVSV
jgi:hypothetical protein